MSGLAVDPVEAMLPAAAALAVAVCDYDPEGVSDVLTGLDRASLHALAIALAANVDLDRALTVEAAPRRGLEIVQPAITAAAEAFQTDVHAILSASRTRHTTDARAVAMYVCKLVGLSSSVTGAHFHRDHSTVLHAWGRVGEDRRLRTIAARIAIQCGWSRERQAS